jgi:predicted nucleic acid-binding Zn ribbon protein
MVDTPQDENELAKTAQAVQRRQRHIPLPKQAARWVSQLIARRGIAETQSNSELETAWREIVGPALAEQTRVGAIRRGVCEITVENSALLQQISFRQRDFLTQIQAQKPHFAIQSFRFRVGPIR